MTEPQAIWLPMKLQHCFVPMCKNSSTKMPDKLFFKVPNKNREAWSIAAGRSDVPKSSVDICEDHIDPEKDIDNYLAYKYCKYRPRLRAEVPSKLSALKLNETLTQASMKSVASNALTSNSSPFIPPREDKTVNSVPEVKIIQTNVVSKQLPPNVELEQTTTAEKTLPSTQRSSVKQTETSTVPVQPTTSSLMGTLNKNKNDDDKNKKPDVLGKQESKVIKPSPTDCIKCIVKSCKFTLRKHLFESSKTFPIYNMKFHKLPQDEGMKKKWTDSLGPEYSSIGDGDCYLCDWHYRKYILPLYRTTYRWCVVPNCNSRRRLNDTENRYIEPGKLFIKFPKDAETRAKWAERLFKISKKDQRFNVLCLSHAYICQDHFDLRKYMVNYNDYLSKGTVDHIILRKECMPYESKSYSRFYALDKKIVCKPETHSLHKGTVDLIEKLSTADSNAQINIKNNMSFKVISKSLPIALLVKQKSIQNTQNTIANGLKLNVKSNIMSNENSLTDEIETASEINPSVKNKINNKTQKEIIQVCKANEQLNHKSNNDDEVTHANIGNVVKKSNIYLNIEMDNDVLIKNETKEEIAQVFEVIEQGNEKFNNNEQINYTNITKVVKLGEMNPSVGFEKGNKVDQSRNRSYKENISAVKDALVAEECLLDNKEESLDANYDDFDTLQPEEKDDSSATLTAESDLSDSDTLSANSLDLLECDFCHLKFTDESDFVEHAQNYHADKNPSDFQCEKCLVYFATEHEIIEHYSLIHKFPLKFKCSVCIKFFCKETDVTQHLLTVHKQNIDQKSNARFNVKEKRVKDNIFGDSDKDLTSLNKFKDTTAKHKTLKERKNETKKIFKRKNFVIALRKQKNTSNKNTILDIINTEIRCPECGINFSNEDDLDEHDKVIHKNILLDPFKSKVKNNNHNFGKFNKNESKRVKYDLLGTLTEKFEKHKYGKIKYNCFICFKEFALKKLMNLHIKNVHVRNEYCCDYCMKKFKFKYHLKRHILVHKQLRYSDKEYQCSMCIKGFTSEKSLQAHMYHVHSSREYFCDYCMMKFKVKETLKRHISNQHERPRYSDRTRTGIVCSHCHNSFKKQNLLALHIRKCHSDVKCQICHVMYRNKAYLLTHVKRDHGGERKKKQILLPNDMKNGNTQPTKTCPYCSQSFTDTEVHLNECVVMNKTQPEDPTHSESEY